MYVAGMQEYIEAVALWHYVDKRNIISLNEVQERLTFTQACLRRVVYCKFSVIKYEQMSCKKSYCFI